MEVSGKTLISIIVGLLSILFLLGIVNGCEERSKPEQMEIEQNKGKITIISTEEKQTIKQLIRIENEIQLLEIEKDSVIKNLQNKHGYDLQKEVDKRFNYLDNIE